MPAVFLWIGLDMTDLFSLASKMASLESEAGRGLPPVEKWNPSYCGEIDIVIRRDGLWFHEGSPIGRPQLVRLFSTVLRREGGEYYLVTPVEKMKITVEDVPFLAVEMDLLAGPVLRFRTNVGDEVLAGPEHEIIFRQNVDRGTAQKPDEGLVPYLHVRRGLEARLTRPVYYQLAELAETDPAGGPMPGVISHGAFFAFANTAAQNMDRP